MRRIVLALPILASLLAPPAGAQNLLSNPDFTTDVVGWESDLLLQYSAVDGRPSPGSAKLTDYGFGGSTTQCVDVSSLPTGEPLAFGAYLGGGDLSFESSSILLQMIWYANTDCSEPNIVGGAGNRSNAGAHPAAEWFRIDCFIGEGCAPLKPEGANSLRFEVLEAIYIPAPPKYFYIDGLFLERDLLFRDGFELGTTAEWSATAPS